MLWHSCMHPYMHTRKIIKRRKSDDDLSVLLIVLHEDNNRKKDKEILQGVCVFFPVPFFP